MFTKRIAFCALALLGLAGTACGPAATTAAPATAPRHDVYYAPATAAPATSAPAAPAPALPAPTMASSMGAPSINQPNNSQSNHQKTSYDTFFQDYGVNPRIDTTDDPLSTFGLDVDTGSYTIMRSYVNDGSLPPEDSVRVEEYVNYFDQGYPYPPEEQAFGINVDAAPFPFAENEDYQMMRIGIQGFAVPPELREDISLTFVIDVSGSMNMDNRLGLVKRTLKLLVKQLNPSDKVSIVVYGTNAEIILEPTSASRQDKILRAIDRLEPGGVTNAEAGLLLGYQMAEEAFNSDGINRVILCSDGVANFGETNAGRIWDEVKRYAGRKITLTTVGFGMDNYNDVLMEQLADNGNGFYAYVDDIQEAKRIFVENLTSTLQVIAMDAKIQVEFNPEVVSRYRLVGFENRAIADEDFRNDRVDAGEIGAGASATALYEIKLNPEATGRIATVSLRWKNPDSRKAVEMSEDFYTRQMETSFSRTDPHFQWDVIVAEYAEILRNSYWAQEESLGGILNQAERISDQLMEDENVSEFLELLRHAARYSE
jgi:Ca-activated chloride channel family protein